MWRDSPPTKPRKQTKQQAPLTKQTTAKAQRDNIMALRRPPTRIDLKADDVEEYDKVRDCYYIYCVSGERDAVSNMQFTWMA